MDFSVFMAPPQSASERRRCIENQQQRAIIRTLPFKMLKRQGYRQGLPLDIHITATTTEQDHVVYHCTMESVVTKHKWVVSYRYSEFHAFKTQVDELWTCRSLKCAGSCQAIRDYLSACFPRKRLVGSTSERAIEDRKQKLENVLLHLLRCALLPGSAMKCLRARHQLPSRLFEFLGVKDDLDRRSLLQIYVDNRQVELKRQSSSMISSSSSTSLTSLDSSTPRSEGASSPCSVQSYASTWCQEDDSKCVICLDDLVSCDGDHDVESTVMLPCHHAFHRECVFEWLLFQFHCPLCRSRIGPQAVTNYCCPKSRSQWWLSGFEEDPLEPVSN
ncbi:hypothetical protein Poli38472_009594 [Pythium oligandrum]|uniref:RING-type domain-containing protein n=1 Tax=Pythium oligandrum TaxID=41045 RepID=A0A8K1FGX0_PYTOL|nr:hypothetical protein Poli38472_009594 [Pythium oligandrum]|eukprot:TMW62101.1 hypothetical protein Poli38472_009594 [Pythium oligandrum]